jgi:hypothetical protein
MHLALAPLILLSDVDHDPDAAVRFLLVARAAMWLVASAALAVTFLLARRWAGARTGLLAAALLGMTVAFVGKTVEIRPDGPAVVCVLASWWATLGGLAREPGSAAARRLLLFAGLLLGAAVMLTQKVLFTLPATVVVLAVWALDPRQAGPRRPRLAAGLLFAAGALVPLAITLALFAPHTGIRAFVEANFVQNAAWPIRFSPAPLLVRMTRQNAVVAVLAAVGLLLAALRLRRADAVRDGDALLVLQTLGLLAGAFAIPTPQLQYFVLLLPVVAMLAGRALADLADAGGRALSGAAGPAVRAAVALFGLAAAAVRPAFFFAADLDRARPKLEEQLGRIRLVLATTSARDTVLDGFTGAGVFRPHAWHYFFLHDEIRALLGPAERSRLLGDLRDGRIAPAVVLLDDDLRALSPEVTAFLEAGYAPAGDPVVWVPRPDLDLDGAETAGTLVVGGGPTSSLVGRGWGPPEETDGLRVRRMQGSRSTLRLPLRRPADLVVTVHARTDGAGQGRLGLAVNDVAAGEVALRAGWSDYAFRLPAGAWRAGVNAARLTRDPPAEVAVARVEVQPAPSY